MVKDKETVKNVVKNGLCTGCGTCAGMCPYLAINLTKSTRQGIYLPVIENEKCDLCGICSNVCPGEEIDLDGLKDIIFSDLTKRQQRRDLLIGSYFDCFVGHTLDENIWKNSTSGGLITSLLLFALEEKIIDGALVTRMSKEHPLEPEPFIARTPEDILSGSRSKYCPVPANQSLREILEVDGRYAVVGLPCHLHGVRKAEALNPKLRERIVLHLGIFCSHTVDFNGTDLLLTKLNVPEKEVAELTYRAKGWPGGFCVKLKDGHERFIPLGSYWVPLFGRFFFTPRRCTLCCDGLAELADISFGDAWLPEFRREKRGESILIVRTEAGSDLLRLDIERGNVQLQSVDSVKVIQSQRDQILFKKSNLVARQKLLKFFGRKVPDYGQTSFLQPNFWDGVTAAIPYLNIKISSTRIGRWALRKMPIIVLSYYGNFIQKLHNRSYGEYRSIKAEPLAPLPPKIHIVNSYSPNLGDLAIVSTMVATLRERFPTAEFIISSTNPALTAKYVSDAKVLQSLSSRSSKIWHQSFNFILLIRNWIWLYFRQRGINLFFLARRNTRQALFEYLDADLIISCGGGYLNDNAGPAFLGCLCDIYLAVLIKKPLILYAQSIGPFRKSYLKRIAGYVLNRVSVITLRDEISTEFLKDLKLKTSLVQVAADVALLLPSADISHAKKILADEGIDDSLPFVTITVKPWSFPGSVDSKQKQQQYFDTLIRLSEHIIRQFGASVLFIPMDIHGAAQGSLAINTPISKFKTMAKNQAIKVLKHFRSTSFLGEIDLIRQVIQKSSGSERIKILEGDYDPGEIKAIIALSELHIATRMHSSIFAASTGVPILGIAYEPKMSSFMKVLEQEQFLTDIACLDPDELIVKFDSLWKNKEQIRQVISQRVEVLKKQAALNAESTYNLYLKIVGDK